MYDFTIEVVTDMNRIADAFGKDTVNETALHKCWEDLEETRFAPKDYRHLLIINVQEDCKPNMHLGKQNTGVYAPVHLPYFN